MLNPEIIKAYVVTAELTGTPLSKESAEVAVQHLSHYDTGVVLRALHRCQVELRGPLTLGAVMDRLDDGFPGPDAAWAMVAKLDESATVVWTDEMAEAFALVRGILDDRIAANRAFLEVYRTKLAEARAAARVPHWTVSLGWDATRRAAPLAEAVELGRLPADKARMMLPPAEWPRAWDPARALPMAEVDRQEIVKNLGELTEKLSQRVVLRDDGQREPADEKYFDRLRREIEMTRQQGQNGV